MTAEHEQACERTIASVVHEIDDLQHQLQDLRAVVERVKKLAWNPDLAEEYAASAVVVDATLLQQALGEA